MSCTATDPVSRINRSPANIFVARAICVKVPADGDSSRGEILAWCSIAIKKCLVRRMSRRQIVYSIRNRFLFAYTKWRTESSDAAMRMNYVKGQQKWMSSRANATDIQCFFAVFFFVVVCVFSRIKRVTVESNDPFSVCVSFFLPSGDRMRARAAANG